MALQCAPEQAVEIKRECFDALADICFENEEFTECIEHGEKGYDVKPVKNEVGCLTIISNSNMFSFSYRQVLYIHVQRNFSLTTALTLLTVAPLLSSVLLEMGGCQLTGVGLFWGFHAILIFF